MSIRSLMSEAEDFQLDESYGLAVPVTYNPPNGGDPVPMTAIVDESAFDETEKRDSEGEHNTRRAVFQVAVSFSYSTDGTFDYDGETWAIDGPIGRDGVYVDLECHVTDRETVRRIRVD